MTCRCVDPFGGKLLKTFHEPMDAPLGNLGPSISINAVYCQTKYQGLGAFDGEDGNAASGALVGLCDRSYLVFTIVAGALPDHVGANS